MELKRDIFNHDKPEKVETGTKDAPQKQENPLVPAIPEPVLPQTPDHPLPAPTPVTPAEPILVPQRVGSRRS